jgi:RND family efflux transporter MFP subunit
MVSELIIPVRRLLGLCAAVWAGSVTSIAAEETFRVQRQLIADTKAIFATVQSVNEVPARARIGGTVTVLSVDEGTSVQRDQMIALVVDEKLALQVKALAAQIEALEAQLLLAQTELNRAQQLFRTGTVPKARLDQAQATVDTAAGELRARKADQAVINQQLTEGEVHAPTAGRVINVPVTVGAVILPGESVATVATENFILRLKVPERHARYVKEGDPISLEGGQLDQPRLTAGKIIKVYPQIDGGRVIADAQVAGLGDFFVGERVRVRISAGERPGFLVPADFVTTRVGVDYVRIKTQDAEPIDVAVQRGQHVVPSQDKAQIEILSGLNDGDVLVRP